MTEDRKLLIELKAKLYNLNRELKTQRRRTDKMREAVAAYIEGDISRKKLERVYNDTDYSWRALEHES